MTTHFIPVRMHIYGDDLSDFELVYSSSERQFPDRTEALAWGMDHYGSDDFRIATVTDGRLIAIGWGDRDFDDEDLTDVARQLQIGVAA